MSRLKLSLRMALLGSIGILMLSTFAIIWVSAKRDLRSSVSTMAEALSREALSRVEQETRGQLNAAQAASTLVSGRVLDLEKAARRPLTVRDLPQVISSLHQIMQVYPSLTFLSVSLADRGEYAHVQRNGKTLSAVAMTRPVNGVAAQRYIRFDGDNQVTTRVDHHHRYDPRTRPFFQAAARSGQPVWTDSYLFVEPGGVSYPGLSLATPVFSGDRLAYVLTADFSSATLCDFLKKVRVGRTGYAFVIDDRVDGHALLLAHPNRDLLLQQHGKKTEIARISEVRDSTLRELMKWVGNRSRKGETLSGLIVDQGSRSSDDGEQEYFVTYGKIDGMPDPSLSMGTIVPAAELTGRLAVHERTITIVGLSALGIGLVFSWLIALAISHPLNAVVHQLAQVGQMQFELPPLSSSGLKEVNQLSSGVDQMKLGLRSFSRYVPTDLVRRLLASGAEPVLGGEIRQLTVHFCDITGFASIAEKLPPQELLQLLSECLGELSEEILLSAGTIDKYIGDNIMAFWGAPEPLSDHATRACRAVLANRIRMGRLRFRWSERGLPRMHVRIGLHTGDVIVGNMGSEHRLDYTVLGDVVNVASRLENLNRLYGTEILISETTRRAAGEKLIARPVDWVRVAGREKPLQIFEPLGFEDEMDEPGLQHARQIAEITERAQNDYRERKWRAAMNELDEVLELLPQDGVARVLRARCELYEKNPPPPYWDGADQTSKG